MSLVKENTWFKIAANPKGIKEGLPHHWRCFIVPENEVFTMQTYSVSGTTNLRNFIPGSTDETGLDPRAWISMYGDINISDDAIGVFILKEPPAESAI